MRDLKVEASWPPGACCCWGGASKETRLRKRCWARSPGDAKAMSGGRLIVLVLVGSFFAGQPEASGCRGYARRVLSESRRLRDGTQPSCPVPYELVAPAKPVGLSLIVRGARTRSTGHSGGLCGRYQEAITFGDDYFRLGRKKCNRACDMAT